MCTNQICEISSQYAFPTRFATISYTFHNTVNIQWFANAFHRVVKASSLKVRGYAITVHALVAHVWLDTDNNMAPQELQSRLTFPAPPGLTVRTGSRGYSRRVQAVAAYRAEIQWLTATLGQTARINNVFIKGVPGFI
jgi:hypothetical protein